MRNYITLNGKNSNEINGLLIQELPPISKPQIRTEVEEIDGRDGDIVTKLGFAAYDKEFTVGLYKDFDINAIIAYFNSEGTVVFSNEPDKYYNYQIIDQIDFERLVRYRTATVRMHCQPFKYSNTEGARALGNKGTASGEGSFITLDNTPEAQFSKIDLKGNAEQDGTPTPDNPQPISVVTGENTVKITGRNLFSGDFSQFDNAGGAGTTYAYFKLLDDGAYTMTLIAKNDISEHPSPDISIGFNTNGGNASDGYKWIFQTQYKLPVTKGQVFSGNNIVSGSNKGFVFMHPKSATSLQWLTDNFEIQLEAGSSRTDYEPYQGQQEYTIQLGKNLINPNTMAVGFIQINGLPTTSASTGDMCSPFIQVEPNTQYAFEIFETTQTYPDWIGWCFYSAPNDSAMIGSRQVWQNSKYAIIETPADAKYLRVSARNLQGASKYMLSKGARTTYEAYGSVYLAKIPNTDYVDEPVKVGDTWYIRKAVGKVVLDGSEDWSLYSTTSLRYSFGTDIADKAWGTTSDFGIMCDKFMPDGSSENDESEKDMFTCRGTTYGNRVWFFNPTSAFSGTTKAELEAEWKAKLAESPVTVYFVLATSVDEEITNETLISQLEALYNQAHAYKGRTHVAAIAQGSNVPHIIEAEVQRSSDGNITNNGNIVSKPTLTIYGSGNIGVSLNGYQILEITLGDEEYITIDTAAMEAYKDTLDNLKNRLVNGDYSKFALRPGSNMIEFSGTVSKCVISKYSRWL